ncbi:MAG: peptidoglycan DD-metalloendopeptidase family protein [Propionibacteriaceae bacterium]|jgi:murein DD-endopeptidase MepM/ murein hydrolase activator NlpD|nr:peptidoglycan DD-metalloendopeptidase family protein [Propionibacteriaceae bacterium]
MRGKVLATGLLVLGLLASGAPSAGADNLEDTRDKVRQSLVTAKKDAASAAKQVESATADLESAQDSLAKAEAKLDKLKRELEDAKKEQAEAEAALERAKQALADAEQDEKDAQADVDQQRALIGTVARSEFQKHTDLVGLGIVFEADDYASLSNQLQWSNTIFDSSAVQLQKLAEKEAVLTATRKAKADAKADVEAQTKAAKQKVEKAEALADAAAAQAKAVKALVAANEDAQAAAEADLDSSQKRVKALEKQEKQVLAKIAAAKKAAEEARRKAAAEAKRKKEEAAKKAAEAKAKAEAAAASSSDSEDGDKATTSAPLMLDGSPSPTTAPSSAGFIYPVNAKPGSPFGMRYHPILHYYRMHWGQDFGAKCGAPLYAMADGVVADIRPTATSNGLGNYTVISYGTYKGKSISSGYAHQSKIIVHEGQSVKQGQLVGYVGTTGLSTGCHLHLQIYYGSDRVNPMQFL